MAVIGGGVVGAAVTYTLARRGVEVVLIEAEDELALGASGTNSGIVHTGFDSKPGELETELILRAGSLRDRVLAGLGVPIAQCGALLRPRDAEQAETVRRIAGNAALNGVAVDLHEDGTLEVPGEAISDPVAYTLELAAAAQAGGAEVRTGDRVDSLRREGTALVVGTAAGDQLRCRVAINCAGLYADEVARLAGDDSFAIYPRKGEFFVFDPPGEEPLRPILLPVPTARTKGVLVFPTLDGKIVAGPTAHDQEDKRDWSVREQAWDEVMPKAVELLPALEGAEPVASYAGLRPAGRDGVNYLIAGSPTCAGLINVAAIRSTGVTASLGIADYVAGLVGEHGIRLSDERPLYAGDRPQQAGPWWLHRAQHV